MILCFKRNERPIWKANPPPEYIYSIFYAMYNYYQNQPFADIFERGVLKVCNIPRKPPLLESLFSKVAILEAYKCIKKRLQHSCFPVNIANFLRKFHLKNTTGGCFCNWNSRKFDYINREIDDIYFQYNTLCLYYVFLATSFAEVIKTRYTNSIAS